MTSDVINAPATRRPAGLLVVTIDRLPAWILPAYGATWVAMPRLDALAARGVVFDRVITPSTDPRRTLRDLAGGEPGGREDTAATERAAAPLAAGWRMAVVTDDASLTAADLDGAAGSAVGGGEAIGPRVVALGPAGRTCRLAVETTAARLVDAAIEAVVAGHRLVWCHVSGLGVAWDAPPQYRERYVDPEDPPPPAGGRVPSQPVDAATDPDLVVGYRQVYAGQLTLLDEQLGRLFAALPGDNGRQLRDGEAGWGVLVAGVRGLPLGIHGWLGSGGPSLPYGELVHVPAILVDPAGRMAGQRYGGLVVPADLGATLRGWVAGERLQAGPAAAIPPWRGRSLEGLLYDWSATRRDRVVVTADGARAVVTPSWHALVAGPPASVGGSRPTLLFAKPDDFFELADVADRCPDVAEGLGALADPAADHPVEWAWSGPLPKSCRGEPDAG